jgi:trehalose 6-phosphate phosphatase
MSCSRGVSLDVFSRVTLVSRTEFLAAWQDGAVELEEIVAAVRGALPGALVALDFDGTLAEIMPDPSASRPVEGAVAALVALTRAGARVAVITGRDARTVLRLGGLDRIADVTVAGLYGAETWHDGHLETPPEPASVAALRRRLPGVVASAVTDDDVWVEDKRLSLVVHTRRAADPAEQLALVREPVARLAAELGLETHDGRAVLEVRIPGFDKGSALARLVDELVPTAVLFAGDDLGDVPAFALTRRLQEAGHLAWSIAVGSGETDGTSIGAAAHAQVRDPVQLVAVLAAIARPAT